MCSGVPKCACCNITRDSRSFSSVCAHIQHLWHIRSLCCAAHNETVNRIARLRSPIFRAICVRVCVWCLVRYSIRVCTHYIYKVCSYGRCCARAHASFAHALLYRCLVRARLRTRSRTTPMVNGITDERARLIASGAGAFDKRCDALRTTGYCRRRGQQLATTPPSPSSPS